MRHYQQWYRGKAFTFTEQATMIECPQCGESFKSGNNKIYCGRRCRELVKYSQLRDDPARWAAYLETLRNGYTKKREQPGYINPLVRESAPCSEDDCDRLSVGRGWCKMHYRRWARAQGMENPPSAAWNDNRRNNRHARRARLKGATRGNKVLIQALV